MYNTLNNYLNIIYYLLRYYISYQFQILIGLYLLIPTLYQIKLLLSFFVLILVLDQIKFNQFQANPLNPTHFNTFMHNQARKAYMSFSIDEPQTCISMKGDEIGGGKQMPHTQRCFIKRFRKWCVVKHVDR